jgi:hypothetical protein
MKNFGLLILGIILGASAMYFYSNGTEREPEALALIKPKGVITPKEAKVLNDDWTKKRANLLFDSIAGRPDNRSAWWSVEEIQNYINYAANQTGELGYEMDGLRVYFGVYPKSAPDGRANYSTVFIVPTGKKIKSQGAVIPLNLLQGGGGVDIDLADPLNRGETGIPPGSGYGGN